jgi:HAE1 family hydrophobic/amphiphilic exporter-1
MLVILRNFRMTFISVVTSPVSIIGAFVAMYALGFTINNMTMLALSLAIGLVIDDAIVVLENIFRHVEQEGKAAMAAAREGTDEIGFAVIAASSSIIAVFLPVAFMPGIIGRFFFQFGLTVTLAVLISVVVSLTLIPMLCSRLLKHNPHHGRVFRSFELGFRAMERFYGWALDKALRHRWLTLLAAVTFFVVGVGLIPFVKQEFSTQADESRFMVRFELPTGTSLAASEQALRMLEETLFAQEEVRSAFAALGLGGGVNSGLMFVNLLRPWEREATQNEVIARLRDLLREAVPSAFIAVEAISPIGGGQRNADLQFIVQGPTVAGLEEVTARMLADMRGTAGFVDVDSDLRLSKPEVRISIDRNLADDLGVDVMTIVETFNALFAGADVAKFKEGSKRYDIRVRAAPEARVQPQDINRIVVRAASGALVSSPNLVTFEEGLGPDKINRYNRQRSVTLFANLDGVALGEALQAMEAIAERHVPSDPGWSTALGGSSEAFAESFQYLFYALIIAILVIYVVLGSQFESFIHPFTVLMSVPLAVIGGIGLLLVTGKTLDIFSFIGFVMLIGIVTKNAILLLDFTNQMRLRGVPRDEALRRAGPLRLRPILMTAFTTMAAVLPVALAISEGGESRAPMGVAVIGGMMTSTLLTLLVIPCVYTVMDDMIAAVERVFGLASPAGPHGAEKQTEVQ